MSKNKKFLFAKALFASVWVRDGTLEFKVIDCVGGVLSPLLSNILLDELDKELEGRGHSFCRYADDCNIYVRSKAAGERVMKSITEFLTCRLRLRVNEEKSAVARPWQRKFLGYSMTFHRQPRLKVAAASVQRLREKLRMRFREGRGRNLKRFIEELNTLLRGWINYFRLAEVMGLFDELDGWLRRKLRCLLWRQWKRTWPRAKALMKQGLDEARAWQSATNGRGPWWNAGASHMNEAFPKSYFDKLGLISLLNQLHKLQITSGTAVYGTVRTVVWEDGGSNPASYPIAPGRARSLESVSLLRA